MFTRRSHSIPFLLSLAAPVITQPTNGEVILLAEGDSRSITCSARSYPAPIITWERSQLEVMGNMTNPSGVNSFEELPEVSTVLSLVNVVPELSSEYTCLALIEATDQVMLPSSITDTVRSSVSVQVSGKMSRFFHD